MILPARGWTYLGAALLVGAALGAGWLLGGTGPGSRWLDRLLEIR